MAANRPAAWLVILGLTVVLSASPARALIYYATDDPAHNTSAPIGTYEGSGWQWQGQWKAGLGTPIAPRYMLTAEHWLTSSTFTFRGQTYSVVADHPDPLSDLRVVEVDQDFPTWAPLFRGDYLKGNESIYGREIVIHGRGYTRGDDVLVADDLRGWKWSSTGDGTLRWGTNVVTTDSGTVLQARFDSDGLPDEVHLAQNDSGGGAFVLDDDGIWKLVGVNYYVDGPYDLDSDHENGNEFQAALFNEWLIYEQGRNSWDLNTSATQGRLTMTSVRERVDWIDSIIGDQPLPGDLDFDGNVSFFEAAKAVASVGRETWDWEKGDFDHDGVVTASDADQAVSNYPGVMPAPSAVPEPASVSLLALGALAFLRRR